MKKKILLYGDSPLASTGLGKLHRLLLKELSRDFEICVVGLNHFHYIYSREDYPYEIIPTSIGADRMYGTDIMKALLSDTTIGWDYIITSHDLNKILPFIDPILKLKTTSNVKWINYSPIDRFNISDLEAKLFDLPDISLTYSDYTVKKIKEMLPKTKVKRVYLPLDFSELKPTDASEFRKKYFEIKDKDFLITFIGKNQPRKDVPSLLEAFKELSKKSERFYLYLHCGDNDGAPKIEEMVEAIGINPKKIIKARLTKGTLGVSDSDMNLIYNASDLIVSASRGEGFGYSTVESLAVKKPFLGPNNTSFSELLGDGEYGYLANIKSTVWEVVTGVTKREIIDQEDFVNKAYHIYKNYDEALEKAEKGYGFVQQLDINLIIKEWLQILN